MFCHWQTYMKEIAIQLSRMLRGAEHRKETGVNSLTQSRLLNMLFVDNNL